VPARASFSDYGRKARSHPSCRHERPILSWRGRCPSLAVAAIEHALYVTVDAIEVQLLAGRLDRIYEENHADLVDNAAYDLVFVPHPEPCSMFHNSNQVVAGWLEQLGCRFEGPTLFAIWRLGAD
jgi:hypothetical protein